MKLKGRRQSKNVESYDNSFSPVKYNPISKTTKSAKKLGMGDVGAKMESAAKRDRQKTASTKTSRTNFSRMTIDEVAKRMQRNAKK